MPVYPKEYLAQTTPQIKVDASLVFALMPFQASFDAMWSVVQNVVEGDPFNCSCVRADQISRSGYIMEDVLEYIARANVVLAELTGQNPNVFYELGIAHTFKSSSQVLLLAQSMDYIPFDLRQLRILIYKPDLSDLKPRLTEALIGTLPRRYRLVVRAKDRKSFPSPVPGRDRCLYQVECEVEDEYFLADDSVKLAIRCTRFVVGEKPALAYNGGDYLGPGHESTELPNLDWVLRREGGDRTQAILVLERKTSSDL